MTKHKTSFALLEIFAILIALLHFVFLSISTTMVDTQSLILNLIPYGLPIWIFACARNNCADDKPVWSKSGFVAMVLFALTFVAMSAHVTLAFFLSGEAFINVYFNIPVVYSAPLLLFAVLWAGTKNNRANREEKGFVGRFITILPKILLITMISHTVTVSVIEIVRQSGGIPSTSAPWWVMPLVISFCSIIAIAISLLIRSSYNRITANR